MKSSMPSIDRPCLLVDVSQGQWDLSSTPRSCRPPCALIPALADRSLIPPN
jgi:hypothetical protein